MSVITGYFTIRATIKVADETVELDDILQQVSQDCDYHLSHCDDVCEIVDTELVHQSLGL